MIGITDGMRYAFENGLNHRDLKMSNILVSSRGEAKIVDFGLASMDETLTDDALADLPNTRTIDYAALERATSVRKDDSRSDIYFLGCIYYNMLTGQPPLAETRDRLHRLSKQRFLDVVPIQQADPSIPATVAVVVNKAMSMAVDNRYQSPAAMLADLRSTERRLQGEAAEQSNGEGKDPSGSSSLPDIGRSVMVVESDEKIQDVFREGFKRAGYRVLVIADPVRAVSRFRQDPTVADCAVFNAQVLGEAALDSFNELGENDRTKAVPAVLLLDETQREWKSQAMMAQHRVVLPMPVTMRQLRTLLAQLAPAKV
jgi:serine/threonine-protein kinase